MKISPNATKCQFTPKIFLHAKLGHSWTTQCLGVQLGYNVIFVVFDNFHYYKTWLISGTYCSNSLYMQFVKKFLTFHSAKQKYVP